MAAPSPINIPLRSFEKGRQVSGDMMRMASQPFMALKVMLASVPPVTAQVTLPLRTIWNAWPMACVADAQADETATFDPAVHRDLARRRADHGSGDSQGMQPRGAFRIETAEVFIKGCMSARSSADDRGSSASKLAVQRKPRLAYCLPRSNDGELRNAVKKEDLR
jgi:hypothetical protein